jgi:hypothetical protein
MKALFRSAFFAAGSAFSASRRIPVVSHGVLGYSDHIENPNARRNIMNITKHMEAVFVAALAFAGSASYLVESLPEAQARVEAPLASSIATPTKLAVVTVTAKRMTAEEKQASLQAERAAGSRI